MSELDERQSLLAGNRGVVTVCLLVCRRLPCAVASSRSRGARAADLGCGWCHKEVPQAHGPEQAIRAAEAGVRVDHKGVALHEGAQVQHLLQLLGPQGADDGLLVVLGPQLQRPLLQLLQQLQTRLRSVHRLSALCSESLVSVPFSYWTPASVLTAIPILVPKGVKLKQHLAC